jgi:hypothetical protein
MPVVGFVMSTGAVGPGEILENSVALGRSWRWGVFEHPAISPDA